jgi:hypothetical protein
VGKFISTFAVGDAEKKAALALGVDAETVVRAAFRLWGQSLTDEREMHYRMLDEQLEPRSAQAAKGHITRHLVAQLEASPFLAEAEGNAHGEH